MDLAKLLALGAVTFGNQIDFRNKTIGLITPEGETVLTPEGLEMVLAEAPADAAPAPRRTRAPKATVAAAEGQSVVGEPDAE